MNAGNFRENGFLNDFYQFGKWNGFHKNKKSQIGISENFIIFRSFIKQYKSKNIDFSSKWLQSCPSNGQFMFSEINFYQVFFLPITSRNKMIAKYIK